MVGFVADEAAAASRSRPDCGGWAGLNVGIAPTTVDANVVATPPLEAPKAMECKASRPGVAYWGEGRGICERRC